MILKAYNTWNKHTGQVTVSQTITCLSVLVNTTVITFTAFLPCFELQKKPLKETLPHSRQQGHRPRTANKNVLHWIHANHLKHMQVYLKNFGALYNEMR